MDAILHLPQTAKATLRIGALSPGEPEMHSILKIVGCSSAPAQCSARTKRRVTQMGMALGAAQR
jgi:hypothetical protein